MALAQEAPKPPPAAAGAKKPEAKTEKPEKEKLELNFTGTALGAYDTNIFDKGANTVQAAGADVTLGLTFGVPISQTFGWASGIGFGTNYRDGVSGAPVGGANALRIDAHAKTGIEALLAGKTSLPGRHVKDSVFPAIKLAIEGKYALWANPLLSQPAALSDETVDALEPTEDEEPTDSGGGGGGDETAHREHHPSTLMLAEGVEAQGDTSAAAGGEAAANGEAAAAEEEAPTEAPAEVPVGGQTFSNPNTHHKVTGVARLSIDLSKKLSLGVDGGAGRDIVQLEDNVEVNPQYNEFNGGASVKYKLSPKLLWISVGYVFERRLYDELKPSATGGPATSQNFDVQGGKLGLDIPLKPAKFKLSYDIRLKLPDTGSDTTRHQVQLAVEIPIVKPLAAVIETRFTDTVLNGAPDSIRLIGLAGLKVHL